jgi:hypothetical protein
VVSGGNVFQTIMLRRDPELIAFTLPNNAKHAGDKEPLQK